jgi:hypothetical protein
MEFSFHFPMTASSRQHFTIPKIHVAKMAYPQIAALR